MHSSYSAGVLIEKWRNIGDTSKFVKVVSIQCSPGYSIMNKAVYDDDNGDEEADVEGEEIEALNPHRS